MDDLRRKARLIYRRLHARYGEIERPGLDAVSELVATILSQNTSDLNSGRAYERLRAALPTWEAVRDAPVAQVREAIRPAGLYAQKAPRIQGALRTITARTGGLNLDFLRDMPVAEARAWLTSIDGVGPKTASIVLLFALDRPAFPVDTHVHRVAGRLGLIGPRVTAEQAHDLLAALVPPKLYLPFHLLLITHGREICHARRPECAVCPVKDVCDYYQSALAGSGNRQRA